MASNRAARRASGSEHAHAASAGTAVEVVVIETEGNETRLTIYDPAKGVTPEVLADELRGKGKDVQLIRHEPGAVSDLAPNDCAYGYARTVSCPVSFWVNNGRSNPLVIFNDLQRRMACFQRCAQVESGRGYRFRISLERLPGHAGWQVVCRRLLGDTSWEGQTTLTWESGAHVGTFTSAYVQLNSRHTPQGWTRNNTATHELGHVLGLGHNGFVGDVMWELPSMREDLGGENRTLLESVYSVVR